MKINSINYTPYQKTSFKGTKKLSYGDSQSEESRELMRQRLEGSFQTPGEYNQRMSEYELNKLLGTLMKKNTPTNEKLHLDVYNLRPLANNSYRGATLANKRKRDLEKLKQAGIKTIISFDNHYDEEMLQNEGFNYFRIDGQKIFEYGMVPAVSSKYSCLRKYYKTDEEYTNHKKEADTYYNIRTRQFIEKEFLPLMKLYQKGNFYCGCAHGIHLTDKMLYLMASFNPKAKKNEFPIVSTVSNGQYDIQMNLYNNLTEEDKYVLGWNNEFDEDFRMYCDYTTNKDINPSIHARLEGLNML